jgi:hypothetical protein
VKLIKSNLAAASTLSENFPSLSVVVATDEPFTKTLAPMSGFYRHRQRLRLLLLAERSFAEQKTETTGTNGLEVS